MNPQCYYNSLVFFAKLTSLFDMLLKIFSCLFNNIFNICFFNGFDDFLLNSRMYWSSYILIILRFSCRFRIAIEIFNFSIFAY